MKALLSLSLATLAALSMTGCAGPYAKPVLSADSTCRLVARPVDQKLVTYCGTRAAWNEFDSQAAATGLICKGKDSRRQTCMNEQQWDSYSRRARRVVYPAYGFPSPNPSMMQSQVSLGMGTIWDNQIQR